jgi:cell division septation protein DedD
MQEHADQTFHSSTPLPLVFGRVLSGPDSTATVSSSRIPTIGSLLLAQPTLSTLFEYIVTHYPESPQARRAERLQAVLAARATPRADSLAHADSVATSATAMDSTAVDSTAIAVAPDSVASDSVASDSAGTPLSALQVQPDTASADTAQGGAPPARAAWTIILATRDGQDVASNLQRAYQSRFQSEELSVRVRTVEAAGTLRYQVILGAFATEQDAAAIMQRFRMRLPGTARVERIP